MPVTDFIEKRNPLPGHIAGVVRLEGAERLDGAYHLSVRTQSGLLGETLISDEAHTCSALSRRDPAPEREKLDRTKRYGLAEGLARRSERLLLAMRRACSLSRDAFRDQK